jgi:hypothetical protein
MIKFGRLHFLHHREKWRAVVASSLFLVSAFAFAGHAEAHVSRHHHHNRHDHHRSWHRARHHVARYHERHAFGHHRPSRHARFAVRRVDPRSWRATAYEGGSNVLAVASHFVGSRNPTGFRGPWCKAFVNMVARETGHPANASLRAVDALHMGYRVRSPRPGDVAVMRSHTTFFAGYGGRGFLGLGGNQGHHRVTVSSYPLRRVIAWVRLR